MADPEEAIVIYEAQDELTGLSIRDLLLEADIPAMVRQTFNPGLYAVLWRQFGLWGEVLVYRRDEEKARELIGGFLGHLGMLEELDPAELEAQATQYPPAE